MKEEYIFLFFLEVFGCGCFTSNTKSGRYALLPVPSVTTASNIVSWFPMLFTHHILCCVIFKGFLSFLQVTLSLSQNAALQGFRHYNCTGNCQKLQRCNLKRLSNAMVVALCTDITILCIIELASREYLLRFC